MVRGLRRLSSPNAGRWQAPKHFEVRYRGAADAIRAIYETNGVRGFWWGMRPRMLQMGPACAISWGAYESMKHTLDRLGVGRIGTRQ